MGKPIVVVGFLRATTAPFILEVTLWQLMSTWRAPHPDPADAAVRKHVDTHMADGSDILQLTERKKCE